MSGAHGTERFETVVIGGGQAGLTVGYHLAKRGRAFVILDASERIGDAWRGRWDSLRIFTPAKFSGLSGMRFPGPANSFPTKDQMADFLEAYAKRFELPVRNGVCVDGVSRNGSGFVVSAGELRFEAENVVVAMSSFQDPYVPAFAGELDPGIVQLHSSAYRSPDQLQEGGVLIVGASNSGAEIALELAPGHRTWMSGRDPGHVPFRIEGLASRLVLARLVLRFFFHRVLTVRTPLGRKMRAKSLRMGGAVVRQKPKDLVGAGVERVPRTAGVEDGRPVLDDGRALDVANVVWCTGFRNDFSWIDLPIHGEEEPLHERGIVPTEPGLYFVGLEFLYSVSSEMIHGVGRDAKRIAADIAAAARQPAGRPEIGAALTSS